MKNYKFKKISHKLLAIVTAGLMAFATVPVHAETVHSDAEEMKNYQGTIYLSDGVSTEFGQKWGKLTVDGNLAYCVDISTLVPNNVDIQDYVKGEVASDNI
jgi:hypothetical protein